MRFEPGDIIGGEGIRSRTVIYRDESKRIYGLRFADDSNQTVYKWDIKHAHETYSLQAPDHIPNKQKARYLREKRKKHGRYKNNMRKPSL